MLLFKKCTEEKTTTHTHTHSHTHTHAHKQSEKYVNQNRKTFM